MNPSTLRHLLLPLFACLAVLTCAAKPLEPATVVPLGGNTYSISREGKTAFSRDLDKLKEQVQDDATQYCAAQGKHLKVVSLTGEKPWFSLGYIKAKIVFQALDAAELAVASAPAAPAVPDAATAVAMPSPTGDLYADLLKLDDLRKKGILTDAEFQAEKQKVLNRSK